MDELILPHKPRCPASHAARDRFETRTTHARLLQAPEAHARGKAAAARPPAKIRGAR